MIINCFFSEEEQYPDIIYVPSNIENIDALQEGFFEWIFDEKKSNAQFTEIDGMKACTYDSENFIYWLNEVHFNDEIEKAFVISAKAYKWNDADAKLFF